MPGNDGRRDLLLGMLALEKGLITREALVAATRAWAGDGRRSLGEVLVEHGALGPPALGVLEGLVDLMLSPGAAGPAGPSVLPAAPSAGDVDLLAMAVDPPDGDPLARRSTVGPTTDFEAADPRAADGDAGDDPGDDGGRFVKVRDHREGGLGVVSIAVDRELGREVALKEIKPRYADDPARRSRFVREAEVTGMLAHHAIVPVYSLGLRGDGRPYYAMRFIDGISFEEAIEAFHDEEAARADRDARSHALRALLRQFQAVCDAVHYAHGRGVIHRDLKPRNIMVSLAGEAFLVDWGLAKVVGRPEDDLRWSVGAKPTSNPGDPDGTPPGAVLGTPAYIPREQAEGRLDLVGPRSDIYGLGATLYHLLTGRPPGRGSDPSTVLPMIHSGRFPRPREVNPAVPPALEAICLRATAPEPEDRYETAQVLGEEVERWLADERVLAYPEPLPDRVMRWMRRHRPWVAAAAAVLVLAVLGLAIHARRIALERSRTAEQLAMTREALRDLLVVSAESLASVPNTESLRERVAGLVLERYRRLGAAFPGDPGVRLESAQVGRVVGGIRRVTGRFEEARASYTEAIGALTALAGDDPGRPEYRRWLAESLIDRGELYRMNGRTRQAEGDLRAAIDQADRAGPAAMTPGLRLAKASALINLSDALLLEAQPVEARATADRAVSMLRPLAEHAEPGILSFCNTLLTMALENRGAAPGDAGDRDGAARDLDEAARIAGSVARGDELYDDAQFQLAAIARLRGEQTSKDASKLAESEKDFGEASRILARLIGDHGLIPHYREEMAATLVGRAGVGLAPARIPEARRDCEAARGHLAGLIEDRERRSLPENPRYLSLLGQVLEREAQIHLVEGRPAEGRSALDAAAERLTRAIELDPARQADRAHLERIRSAAAEGGNVN